MMVEFIGGPLDGETTQVTSPLELQLERPFYDLAPVGELPASVGAPAGVYRLRVWQDPLPPVHRVYMWEQS